MLQKVLIAACLALLTACSSLPPAGDLPADSGIPAESASTLDEATLVLETIALAQRMASASGDEQRRELSAAAKTFARERSAASRLRYGVLLSLPALAGADMHRALAMLEPLSTSGSSGPLRQLTALIVLQLTERTKEQRRAQQFKEQLDESRANERGLNERALQLKTQLDELRAIERALIERGGPRK